MTNTLEDTKFDTIHEQERLVAMYEHDMKHGLDPETRVTALECYKSTKRNLYRLIDELSHAEIVEYGIWRNNR